jgi:hypothetical protein
LFSPVSSGQSASDFIYDLVVDEARPSTGADRVCNDKFVGNPLLKGSFSYRNFDLRFEEGDVYYGSIGAKYDHGLRRSIDLTSRLLLVKAREPDYTLLDGQWHLFGPPSLSSPTGDEEIVQAIRVDGNTSQGTIHFEACLYGTRPADYEAFIADIDTTEDEINIWISMSIPEGGGPAILRMPAPVDWRGYELVVSPPYRDGYPCGDPGIVLDYDPNHDEYHLYPSDYTTDTNSSGEAFQTKICSKDTTPYCSADIIFDLMVSDARFIAPTAQQHRVKHCTRTLVDLSLLGIPLARVNPIRSMVSREVRTVTNYTVPGHLLHPGRVVRTITEDEDGVYVETWGEGTGNCLYSAVDEYSEHLIAEVCEHAMEYGASWVWTGVDKRLKDRYDELMQRHNR